MPGDTGPQTSAPTGYFTLDNQPAVPISHFDIILKKVENGFIVNIGCKTFVSQKWDEVADGLKLHFEDPQAAYKKYVDVKKSQVEAARLFDGHSSASGY